MEWLWNGPGFFPGAVFTSSSLEGRESVVVRAYRRLAVVRVPVVLLAADDVRVPLAPFFDAPAFDEVGFDTDDFDVVDFARVDFEAMRFGGVAFRAGRTSSSWPG